MSAVFLAPPVVEPSIVSDTAQASAPASRVLLDEPGLVARGTGTLSVTFDMGSTAYDTVAAIRNNLPAAATIRVRAASSADMTSGVVLDTTVQAWSGEAPTTKAISYIPLPAIYTERYVRVDLIAVGASLIEVSRIIIGKRIEVDGIDRGAVRRQNIRHNSRRRLAECGPRQGVDVRRRTCGAASADVRWSVA